MGVDEIVELFANVGDVSFDGAAGFGAIAFAEGLHDGAMGLGRGAGREVVGVHTTKPDLVLNNFENRGERRAAGAVYDFGVEIHVLFDEFELAIGFQMGFGAFDAFIEIGEKFGSDFDLGDGFDFEDFAQVVEIVNFFL